MAQSFKVLVELPTILYYGTYVVIPDIYLEKKIFIPALYGIENH
jgi:hypothetical protein